MYTVTVYWEKSTDDYLRQAINKVHYVLNRRKKANNNTFRGDILVFLTNPEEIEKACSMLKCQLKKDSDCDMYEVLPLHGKLAPEYRL